MQKNKEMKESLKKFREEAEKLEQSDALKSARKKFQTVESEANKSSEVLKEKIEGIKGKVYLFIFGLHTCPHVYLYNSILWEWSLVNHAHMRKCFTFSGSRGNRWS